MRSAYRRASRLLTIAAILAASSVAPAAAQPGPDDRRGSPPKHRPLPVYAAEPSDPWNRIFHALFTRVVHSHVSEEFAAGAPLERVRVMGFPDLPVTREVFERIEGGDRAIEPLDPFPVHVGSNGSPQRVLDEPQVSRLEEALTEVLREEARRPPLARALMQSDLWAAHDILFAARTPDEARRGRKDEILGLLARSIKRLALSKREIAALPENYDASGLPFDLFAAGGDWIEVEYFPDRFHDSSADFRRATRVFLKPSAPPRDRPAWLDGLREVGAHATEKFDAVALVVQLLLVDDEGGVAPTKLTYEVQVRTFPKGDGGRPAGTGLTVAELSRKALLLDRRSGGLLRHEERDPSYLPASGNDYFFATEQAGLPGRDRAILATLRRRCQSCHGERVETVFTFSFHDPDPPHVRPLSKADNEHARYVALRKVQRPDFAALKQRWDR